MRSSLASRLFGIPVLALAFGIGGVAFRTGEEEPEPGGLPERADVLNDPAHQATCTTCLAYRAARPPASPRAASARSIPHRRDNRPPWAGPVAIPGPGSPPPSGTASARQPPGREAR